jgi:hypothetical protein
MRASVLNLLAHHRDLEASLLPDLHVHTLSLPSALLPSWLFLRRPEDLTAEDQETVMRLRQLDPEVDLAYLFVQQFVQMMRTRTGESLDAWLLAVGSSPLVDLQSFANSVSEDKDAVLAGLTREESNGPTEGHITRLKLIKRSMYGRAKFDLLRIRVLSSAKNDDKQKKRNTKEFKMRGDAPNSQRTTFRISEVDTAGEHQGT